MGSRFWWLFVCIFIGLVIPVLLMEGRVLARLDQVSVVSVLMLFPLVFFCWWLNVERCFLLVRDHLVGLSRRRMMAFYLVIELFSKTTPLGSGAPVAAVSLLRPIGVPAPVTLSLFVVMALADIAVVVTILTGVFLFGVLAYLGVDPLLRDGITLLMIPLLALSIALMWRHFRTLLVLLLKILKLCRLDPVYRRRVARGLLRIRLSVQNMLTRSLAVWLRLVTLSLFYWISMLSILYCSVLIAGGDVGWPATVAIQILSTGFGELLMLPGAAAGAEFGAAVMLAPLAGAATAGVAIMIWRLMTFHLYLIAGLIASLFVAGGFRQIVREVEQARKDQGRL